MILSTDFDYRVPLSGVAFWALTWPLRARSAFSLDSSATAFLRVSTSTLSLPISDLRRRSAQDHATLLSEGITSSSSCVCEYWYVSSVADKI